MEPNGFLPQLNRLHLTSGDSAGAWCAFGAADLWNWSETAACGGAIFNTRIDITGAPHTFTPAAFDRIAAYCALSLIDQDHIKGASDKLIEILEWQRDVPPPEPEAEVYRLPLRKKVARTIESGPIDFE